MAEKIPPRFRKTKTEKWAVMAPVEDLEKALAEGGKIDVQKKSGDWSSFTVASLGRPFEVDGVQMCYGYGPDEEGEGGSSAAPGGGSSQGASAGGGGGGGGGARSYGGRDREPRTHTTVAEPPRDPSEPMPEYQGGPEDEWQEF
jgi:hypothetical protein